MGRTYSPDFFHCNNCGEEVNLKAKVCPNCGADDETAWKDGINSYLIEEDEDFDYEAVRDRELHGKEPKSSTQWALLVIAIIVLAAMVFRWLW